MLCNDAAAQHSAAILNVVLALLCCALNLALLAVPLVGLLALPSLFGAVSWASSALETAGLLGSNRGGAHAPWRRARPGTGGVRRGEMT